MAKKARKVLKRHVKTEMSKPKTVFTDRLPNNHGEYLELLIKLTKKANSPKYPNSTLAAQQIRLEKQLTDWKKSQK